MAIDSYSSSRAKQQKAFDDYFGGGRSGLSNRPISKGTTISTREKPEKSGIMSSLASAIERGKQTRLRNEARRFGKAGKPNLPRTISDPIVSEFQLANMIDAGYEPARRNLFGNIVNPYGSTGLKQYISFPNLEQNQRNEILNKRVQRFMSPQTDDPSLRRGFGSLFGSSEGEPTISGPLRKQIEPMSPIEMGARGIFSLLPGNIFGPIVSMADPGGTTMVPEFSADYDPDKDPRNNPQSMVGSMLDFFTGGAGTEALSRISDLLPGSSQEVLPEQGPVANPFYPDMRRSVNEPSVIEAAVNEPIIPPVNMSGGSIIPDTPNNLGFEDVSDEAGPSRLSDIEYLKNIAKNLADDPDNFTFQLPGGAYTVRTIGDPELF